MGKARFKATIRFEAKNFRVAKAIALSVTPDNLTAPEGLKVKTMAVGRTVVSTVECNKSFETFLSTINDLIVCLQATEKSLRVV